MVVPDSEPGPLIKTDNLTPRLRRWCTGGGAESLIARIATFIQRSSSDIANQLHLGCVSLPDLSMEHGRRC